MNNDPKTFQLIKTFFDQVAEHYIIDYRVTEHFIINIASGSAIVDEYKILINLGVFNVLKFEGSHEVFEIGDEYADIVMAWYDL